MGSEAGHAGSDTDGASGSTWYRPIVESDIQTVLQVGLIQTVQVGLIECI